MAGIERLNGFILILLFSLSATFLTSQEKLQVEGIIHSEEGGFKFPDNSIQTTASSKLVAQEVSEQRGKVTAKYTGISGVSSATEFDALDVSFKANFPLPQEGGDTPSSEFDVFEIVHNIDAATFPKFMLEFASGSTSTRVTLSYYDSGNTLYMTIVLKNTNMVQSFEHGIQPFSVTSFGHTFLMRFSYNQIQIRDETGGVCECWNIQGNDSCTCD